MDKTDIRYQSYVKILSEELVPAMGCTEPIAIAYAAAKAREVLGMMPDQVKIGVSDNIIKNVKSVVVPNTNGMRGIEAAAAAGIVGGDTSRQLEVIAEVTEEEKEVMREFLEQTPVKGKQLIMELFLISLLHYIRRMQVLLYGSASIIQTLSM